jgi:signal transduction histidine kinase
MAGPVTQRRPTFLWQAALILLPVAVLAVMGWYSLRQDKILAEHDAKDRAQVIADDLLPKIWNELTASTNDSSPSFEVDDAGNLIFPPPYSSVPTPQPFDLTQLNSDQAKLWQQLQNAEVETTNVDALIRICKEFSALNPPENFAAAANYEVGLWLLKQKKNLEAAELFDRVAQKYPSGVGESGVPLQPLAQMKLFEIEPREKRSLLWWRSTVVPSVNAKPELTFPPVTMEHFISADSLCSNIINHPTPLTPYLLAQLEKQTSLSQGSQIDLHQLVAGADAPETQAAVQKWQSIWVAHELSRHLYSVAASNLRIGKGLTLLETNEPTNRADTVSQFRPGTRFDSSEQFTRRVFWINLAGHWVYSTSRGWTHEHSGVKGWLQEADNRWLAVRRDENGSNHWFVCRGEFELTTKIAGLIEAEKQLPEFFGVGVEVAGTNLSAASPDLHLWHYESWANPHSEGGGLKKVYSGSLSTKVLASAAKVDGGVEALKVAIYLTGPDALYQRQRARAFWFGALIVVSTVAALIGLTTAWRAFQRQLQLSEMKSNFVSSVSHELRAPIASVRLMAENLEREKISEPRKQKEYFAFIVQECRRLSSLIENVLDFSRIEQGRKQYDFEPTDIGALVNQTVKLMEPYAVEKGVRLEIQSELQTANSELTVDGRAIQQALVNLIDNAIKHSPKGEAVIVAMETTTDSKATDSTQQPASSYQYSILKLSVSDRGPGIPLDEQEKIFERFYRRGSELRRETVGVGIGLSIVKHIIEAHGGRVRVQSDVGKGSRFTIELPMTKQNE